MSNRDKLIWVLFNIDKSIFLKSSYDIDTISDPMILTFREDLQYSCGTAIQSGLCTYECLDLLILKVFQLKLQRI